MWALLTAVACSPRSTPTDGQRPTPTAQTADTSSGTDTGSCGSWWYADVDGDGLGGAKGLWSCEDPGAGFVATTGDCDDTDPDLAEPLGDFVFEEVSDAAGLTAAGPAWDGSFGGCWREPLAGGAAVADFDGDGDLDVFLPRTALPDELLLNDGHGVFAPAAFPDGPTLSNGALAFDVEGDGDLDLLVTSIADAPDRLWINDGSARFTEEGAVRGLHTADTGCRDHFGAAAGDVDGDGDLDLLIAGWDEELTVGTRPRTRLLLNDGQGVFADATVASGLHRSWDRAALDPVLVDLDGDHDLDLLLVADWNGTTRFLNQGDGRFVEAPLDEVFTDENGMGADLGDVDGDGDLDVFVTSVWSEPYAGCPSNPAATCDGNRLYAAEGAGFVDRTDAAGVRVGQWGWGTAMLDADLDGALDVVLTGGMDTVLFREEPGRLFLGRGDGTFRDATCTSGWLDRGQGRGVVPFDADGDGRLELLVTGRTETPSLWRSRGGGGGWLQLELRQPGRNPFAVGARVRVTDAAGVTRLGLVHANTAYVSSRGPWVHLGLGGADGPVDVEVTWPDGAVTQHPAMGPGRVALSRP
ncbi:MAG: CRTAC1 family protein [Myxococcales bacterium]|nr:CRTAC1 family protein [Myxococcales bacterium]